MTRFFTALCLAVGAASQGAAQSVQELQKDIEGILRPFEIAIEIGEDPASFLRPNRIQPRLQAHHPTGRLVAAFRGVGNTRIHRFEINGGPAPEKQVDLHHLRRNGALWEFYQDGTFIHAQVGNEKVGFPMIKGTYVRVGDGFRFRAKYDHLDPNESLEHSIEGTVTPGRDGRGEVQVTENRRYFAQWNLKYGKGSQKGLGILRYTQQVRAEPGSIPPAPPRPDIDATPRSPTRPAMPLPIPRAPALNEAQGVDLNYLAGSWFHPVRWPDGREGAELLSVDRNQTGVFGISQVAGRETIGRLVGRIQLGPDWVAFRFSDGRVLHGRIRILNERSFHMILPTGVTVPWTKFLD